MVTLSDDLCSILQFELATGNKIKRIDDPAGTNCPNAIILRNPLRRLEIEQTPLSFSVIYWQSNDPHYPIEAGYYSKLSRHVIAGPVDTT